MSDKNNYWQNQIITGKPIDPDVVQFDTDRTETHPIAMCSERLLPYFIQQLGFPMMSSIDCFRAKYSFLSNFYPTQIFHDGYTYPSVEHAFQAFKTDNLEQKALIRSMVSPLKAKRFGKKVDLKVNWLEIRVGVMKNLLEIKFQDQFLKDLLMETGDATIVEGNTWGDDFWGCIKDENGNWVGANVLGKLLMEVRDELRQN